MKKYSMFIGRWQPWHEGHRWLIDQRLKKGKNVWIAIRDVEPNKDQPWTAEEVFNNLKNELSDLLNEGKIKISVIPVVDNKKKLLDLLTSFNTGEIKNFIYIVAGGRGKRMMPLTQNNPKPLLDYMGEPILEKLIKKIKDEKFNNVIISINYLGHKIENHFRDGKKFNLDIRYIKETKELGTAGSFYELNKIKTNLPIIVTNADLVTNLKFRDILNFHYHNNADITVAIKKHEYQNPFGVIDSKGIVLQKIIEKPSVSFNINAGVYVINKNLFKILKKNQYFDIPEFINFYLKKKKKIIIFPLHEDWKDIQQPKDLIK